MRCAGPVVLCLVLLGGEAPGAPRTKADPAPLGYARGPLGKLHQVEVGGPFVGVECHRGSALPTRFSFFYPIQTTLQRATDYWKRADFPVLELGVRSGDGAARFFGKGQFTCEELTPFAARFLRREQGREIRVSYQFCEDQPAAVVTYSVRNTSDRAERFSLFTRLSTSLRSSHRETPLDRAWTEYGKPESTIYTHFGGEAPSTCLFVGNAGCRPSSFDSEGEDTARWTGQRPLACRLIEREKPRRPAAAFAYDRLLRPGQSLEVVQLIGTTRDSAARRTVEELRRSFRTEVRRHQRTIEARVARTGTVHSGDRSLDQSARVAKAVLAANEHHLDGARVPMPCPAEYPYQFTHDILMKNLAASIFDPAVVRRDLLEIARRADPKTGVIPHARYWKADRFVTEPAQPDNWNHFWFVLVSSRYLRHSRDTRTVQRLYPLLRSSVRQMLVNERGGTIWANRPDWWDIGTSFGPRSYMTILAARALREFLYVSTVLGERGPELKRYEAIADRLQAALGEKLWDAGQQYLGNVNAGGEKDPHLYSGSLLAAHLGLLDAEKRGALLRTAGRKLVDPKVGVYNAFPMDFASDEQQRRFRFAGGEAGGRYQYMNGGIWYHGNAWYALGLIADGRQAEALRFVKQVMSLDGIKRGPNGQPAFYEVRSGDRTDPGAYGRVDKPQFLWAASWYLYTLYSLLGLRENAWNTSLEPAALGGARESRFSLSVGGRQGDVRVRGTGSQIRRLLVDGEELPSTVLPAGTRPGARIEVELGEPLRPYLTGAEALLRSSRYDARTRSLEVTLAAFAGHRDAVRFLSPSLPRTVKVNGVELPAGGWRAKRTGGAYEVSLELEHRGQDRITLQL